MNNTIEVIGLGAGDLNQLPLGIYKRLTSLSGTVFVRTKDHPVIKQLEEEGVTFESFDSYYEREDQFAQVYENIVTTLLEQAKEGSIVYAVPGHPMLAEQTVQLLLEQTEVQVEINGGQSYLDDLFTSLKIDPIDGFQFIDGTLFSRSQLNFQNHLIFCQVYDQYIASEVKLTLLEDLPPEYEVIIVDGAGSAGEKIIRLPLEELDRSIEMSNMTSIYIPPVPKELLNHRFDTLREVIATLRGPGGCEWDQAQTHETLREYLLEEAYETIEAIDEQDDEAMIEELGDVLLQVMLHSQIGEDVGYFTVDDVIKGITKKMIYRHPHVFEGSDGDVTKSWDELKRMEKGLDSNRTFLLDSISKSLPSLARADAIQKKVAKVGFDWDDVQGTWEKIEEEINEVQEAIEEGKEKRIEEEFGDVLFSIVNLARYYKVNPELALNRTNKKFITRFTYVEEKLAEANKEWEETTLEEMDYYWEQAKGKGDKDEIR